MATAVAEASLTLPKEKKRRRSHGDRIYYVLIKAIVGVVLAILLASSLLWSLAPGRR